MPFDLDIKNIKKLNAILTGKDSDVIISYKGTAYGVTKPWNVKCDSREVNHENHEMAATELLLSLKGELQGRIAFAEKQAKDFKQALDAISKDLGYSKSLD